MAKLHVNDLDDLVAEINRYSGDFRHPEFVKRFLPLTLEYETHVDDINLSPYSTEYYKQQVSLYEEISGRKLNQADGELHPVDIQSLLTAPNPIGILAVEHMSEHVRSIGIMLSIAGLTGQAEVLDMGAGHGIASEIMAFMACKVHAVDIDPALSELSSRRASARGLQIERSVLNFDDLSLIEEGRYDGAFFSQSLHHCLRPWELIDRLKTKIKPEGVIGFVGEPINDYWWKNWGLRLDEESLFVARSHGWFESGWTLAFITDCFERNGFTLDMFRGGFAGGGIGIATRSAAKRGAILAKATQIGVSGNVPEQGMGGEVSIEAERFGTLIGDRTTLHGRPGFRQRGEQPGPLVYGPYVTLGPGDYEFAALVETGPLLTHQGVLHLDVTSDLGQKTLFETRIMSDTTAELLLATGRFLLTEETDGIEIRAVVEHGAGWTAALPTLRRISPG